MKCEIITEMSLQDIVISIVVLSLCLDPPLELARFFCVGSRNRRKESKTIMLAREFQVWLFRSKSACEGFSKFSEIKNVY